MSRLRSRGTEQNDNGNGNERIVTATVTAIARTERKTYGSGDQDGSDRIGSGTEQRGPGRDLTYYYTRSGKKPDYSTESATATADSRQQPDQKPGTSDRKRKTTRGLGKRNSFPHRGYVVYM